MSNLPPSEKDNLTVNLIAQVSTRLLDVPLTALDSSLEETLAELGQGSHADRAYVIRLAQDGTTLSDIHEWAAEGTLRHDTGAIHGIDIDDLPWSMGQFKRGETIVVTDPNDLPEEAEWERKTNAALKTVSYVQIPLLLDHRVLGWLGFDTVGQTKSWSSTELKLLEIARNAITSSIQRKRREEVIFRQRELSQRVTSMGVLAAGLSHEINNPLAVLIGNLSYIDELLEPDAISDRQLASTLRQAMHDARDGAHQIRQIVADLRALSHGEPTEITAVDLKSVVDGTLRMASNQLRHRAQLLRNYDDAPAVRANASQLSQLVLNLVVNAAQAIPEGRANENEIEISASADDEMVTIEIRDSGCGIPREALPRVFDPFYTTRGVGEGIGIGLAVCHNIVKSFGGEINVGSMVGIGTKVTIKLPRAAPAQKSIPPRRSRILVVDDEPIIRTMMNRFLKKDYEVIEASNGREALGRIDEFGEFDLILCDVTMPDIGGDKVYWAIKEAHPGLETRMIFVTGGALSKEIDQFLHDIPNTLIQKPFEPRQLRDLVAERLKATQ